MIQLQKFKTLIDLLSYFNDEQICRDYLELLRWANGPTCPYKDCQHNKVFKFSNGKTFKCDKCKRQFSIKVGTIFEDSKIPLKKWYAAIYLITSHKKGISSIQLSKDIGVTQKTAWYMNHRVRHSLGLDNDEKLTGVIEADETFIGGKEINKHESKKTKGTQGLGQLTLSQLIDKHNINKAHLAFKMNMPSGTFKNKLSEKQTAYRFTESEEDKLKEILRDMAADIEVVAGISFNSALAKLSSK